VIVAIQHSDSTRGADADADIFEYPNDRLSAAPGADRITRSGRRTAWTTAIGHAAPSASRIHVPEDRGIARAGSVSSSSRRAVTFLNRRVRTVVLNAPAQRTAGYLVTQVNVIDSLVGAAVDQIRIEVQDHFAAHDRCRHEIDRQRLSARRSLTRNDIREVAVSKTVDCKRAAIRDQTIG